MLARTYECYRNRSFHRRCATRNKQQAQLSPLRAVVHVQLWGGKALCDRGDFFDASVFFCAVVIMGARGDTGGATGDGVLGIQSL